MLISAMATIEIYDSTWCMLMYLDGSFTTTTTTTIIIIIIIRGSGSSRRNIIIFSMEHDPLNEVGVFVWLNDRLSPSLISSRV